MSRKPSHQVGPLDTREALWAAIRKFNGFTNPFTARDLQEETTCLSLDTVRDYLAGLVAAGYVALVLERDDPRKPNCYKLLRDVGIEAPRVRRDGTEVTQGRGREQLWRTMRILDGFWCPLDLAIAASTDEHTVAEEEAATYAAYLARAGYLTRILKPSLRYRLLPSRYSGPKPPQIQRVRQVYDPNLGRVVYSAREGKQ